MHDAFMSIAAMPPDLASLRGETLTYSRSGPFSPVSRLCSRELTIAVLTLIGHFQRRGVVEYGHRRWTFERRGWFARTFRVLDGDGRPIARFRKNWSGGGTLELADGKRYRWRRLGFLSRTRAFVREDGHGDPLVTFAPRFSWRGRRGDVTIDADARSLPELALLVMFGWYLVLVRRRSHAH
jgi:hypothetical protein